MVFLKRTVYGALMGRLICLSVAVVLSLLWANAQAASVHKKPAPRWHGYGFLPGYHQPPNNSQPLYAQKEALRHMRRDRRPWYIDPVPRYYGYYDDEWHYLGRPGFSRGGHYNGGTYGPCWTWAPIGPVWNCG